MFRKRSLTIVAVISVLIILSLGSCNPAREFEKDEKAAIDKYLQDNSSLPFDLKPSGLYYLDVQEGTGIMPVKHDTAYIKYIGKLLDGTIFDSNVTSKDSLKVPVDENWLIPGFDEGVTYMKVGGKAMFLMPSKLAYGASGYYSIAGYTPLLFDVVLLKVKPGPGK